MRVIAGQLRGRPLSAPRGDATRPTGSRVKEALFSILANVSEQRVLDLYAGSGALGIEALSRGAAHAVFVEAARPALACLRDNLTKLRLDATSTTLPLQVAAARPRLVGLGPFDLVLCDPPWKDVEAARQELEQLTLAGVIAIGGRVVLEHSAKAPPAEPPGSRLELVDQRRWGDTAVTIYEPAGVPGAASP